MTFQQALQIMVNGYRNSEDGYKAVQVVELAVAEASKTGDPDSSLQDWISAGQYSETDTVESIAEEWDYYTNY